VPARRRASGSRPGRSGLHGADPVSSPAARRPGPPSRCGAQALLVHHHEGWWDDFDVSGRWADRSRRRTQLSASSHPRPPRDPAVVTPDDPIKVGLRTVGGRQYLIAVNLSLRAGRPRPGSRRNAVAGLRPHVPERRRATPAGRDRVGRFTDTIPGTASIYGRLPGLVAGRDGQAATGSPARGSSKLKLEPRPARRPRSGLHPRDQLTADVQRGAADARLIRHRAGRTSRRSAPARRAGCRGPRRGP
jgi:hypothetical protein